MKPSKPGNLPAPLSLERLPLHILELIVEVLVANDTSKRRSLYALSLRSFLRAPNDDRPIDPNDVQLLTSPCLYSISTPGKDWYRWGKLDNAPHLQTKRINYNLVLIPKMVAGLSPNLAKVAICPDWMRRWNERSSIYQTPWPPMEGFFNMSKDAPSFKLGGQLQTFSLPSYHTWPGTNRDYLERFRAESINWSQLNSLTIKGYAGSLTLKYLAEMGNDGELLSLTSLSLDISGGIQSFDDIDEKNSLMIRSLPPLQELNLTGWLGNATYSAVLDCGTSLRKLTFLPVTRCIEVSDKQFLSLTPNHVHALRQRLTKLEELTVRICHVEGTESQVETYRMDHV
jgi:hypothetical protein